MATKDDRPTLLSKMAMFVRNPTKDWSELDRPQPEQESGYDKQALKAMIERKRQNDFVRRREFDQLRKLRSRDASSVAGQARPSLFQSSVSTDPDGRAITLKKIDEIEAQMSKQWWKGKQAAVNAVDPVFPASRQPVTDSPQTRASELPTVSPGSTADPFVPTQTSTLHPADAVRSSTGNRAGQRDSGVAPMSTHLPLTGARTVNPPGRGFAMDDYAGADIGFSASRLIAMEVDELATDPELEEAAIRFANGDDSGAEKGLLESLRGEVILPEVALSWAAALLDLYRATHQRAEFDRAVAEFAPYFDNMTPVWVAIGDGAAPVIAVPGAPVAAGHRGAEDDLANGAIWASGSELTEQGMESLREAMSSNPMPWHLGWSRLTHIAEDAMPLLAGLFSSVCSEPVVLRFSGSDRLVQVLRDMMPSGDRNVSPDWWTVRLDVLRTMQLQDEFELAALDYCVTYEVSPPAWQEARCQYENVVAGGIVVSSPAPTVPMSLDRAGAGQLLELTGQVLGDATKALATLDGACENGERVVVSCRGLVRVDFSAAGSILNWVALRQSEGCQVQFRDVHRLVAAFFNVIGINEHAQVVPRPI
jgi:anti-anti-sigma regulatory factor